MSLRLNSVGLRCIGVASGLIGFGSHCNPACARPDLDVAVVGDASLRGAESRLLEKKILRGNRSPEEIASDNEAWASMTGAIAKAIDPQDQMPGLQLMGIPRRATWNDPNTGLYEQWVVWGDSKPKFAFLYDTAQLRITDVYELFLRNIAMRQVPPDVDKQIKAAEREMDTYRKLYDSRREQAGKEWVRFDKRQRETLPESEWVSYRDWEDETFRGVLDAAYQRLSNATQNYRALVNQHVPDFLAARAIEDYYSRSFQRKAKAPDGTELEYRTFNFTPSLDDFIKEAKANATGGNGLLEFEITRSSYRRHVEESRWNAGGSVSFGFFSIGGGGGRKSITIDTKSESFYFKFHSKGWQVFTVTPGEWFNGTAVQTYKNGPWVKDGVIDSGQVKLFGPNGSMNLMCSKIVVAFRPEITLRLSESEYNYAKSEWSASGGISIGCFSFGGGGGGSTEDVKFDDASRTIIFKDTSDRPQIMAVISNELPDFK